MQYDLTIFGLANKTLQNKYKMLIKQTCGKVRSK